uniref:Polyprotein n=1 Tax=Rhizoctonia solani alpha-like virus 5 TaxID=3162540 RepID=A0AAU6NDU3_9VIRU
MANVLRGSKIGITVTGEDDVLSVGVEINKSAVGSGALNLYSRYKGKICQSLGADVQSTRTGFEIYIPDAKVIAEHFRAYGFRSDVDLDCSKHFKLARSADQADIELNPGPAGLYSTAQARLKALYAHSVEEGAKGSQEVLDAALAAVTNAEVASLNNLPVATVPRNINSNSLLALTDVFPDFNVVSVGRSSTHAALAGFRTLAASAISRRVVHASTMEIGPNLTYLAKNGMTYSHYCSPNITARDSARAALASSVFNPGANGANVVLNRLRQRWDNPELICANRAENCLHQAATIVAINSLQDSSPRELASIMRAHGATVAHVTLNLPIPLLLTEAKEYYDDATDSVWRVEDGEMVQYPSGGGAAYHHSLELLANWVGGWKDSGLFAEVEAHYGSCYYLVVARAGDGLPERCNFDFPSELKKYVLIQMSDSNARDAFLVLRYHFENLVATLAAAKPGVDLMEVALHRIRALKPAIVVGVAKHQDRWEIPTGREPEVALHAISYVRKEALRVKRAMEFMESDVTTYATHLRRTTHEASDNIFMAAYRRLLGEKPVSSDLGLMDVVDSFVRPDVGGPEMPARLAVTAVNEVRRDVGPANVPEVPVQPAQPPAPGRGPQGPADDEDDDFADAVEGYAHPLAAQAPIAAIPVQQARPRPQPEQLEAAQPHGVLDPALLDRQALFALPAIQVNPAVFHDLSAVDVRVRGRIAELAQQPALAAVKQRALERLTWNSRCGPRLHIEGVMGAGKSRAMLNAMESGDVLCVPTQQLSAKWTRALARRNLNVTVVVFESCVGHPAISAEAPVVWVDEVYRFPLSIMRHICSAAPLVVTAGDYFQKLYPRNGEWGINYHPNFMHTAHRSYMLTSHRCSADVMNFLTRHRLIQQGAHSVRGGDTIGAAPVEGHTIHITAHRDNRGVAAGTTTIDSSQGLEAPNVVWHVFPGDGPLLSHHGAIAVAMSRHTSSLQIIAHGIAPLPNVAGRGVQLPITQHAEPLNVVPGARGPARRGHGAAAPPERPMYVFGQLNPDDQGLVGSMAAYLAHPSDATQDLTLESAFEGDASEVSRRHPRPEQHYDVGLLYSPPVYVGVSGVSCALQKLAPGIDTQPEFSETRDREFERIDNSNSFMGEVPDVGLDYGAPLLADAAKNWVPGNQVEAMSAVFSRYLGPAHTRLVDAVPEAERMFKAFVYTFLDPSKRANVRTVVDAVSDWVRSREPNKFAALLRDVENSGSAGEFVAKFFVKAQLKPKFGGYGKSHELEVGQGIMGSTQSVNLSSCPLTVEAFRVLQELSRDDVIWFTGFSPKVLDNHVRHVGGDQHASYTCTDITQQDAHHSAPHRLFGAMLLGLLCPQREMAEAYLSMRELRTVKSFSANMRFTVIERLFSGEAFTIFLNTTTAASENALTFNLSPSVFYMGIGDDSAFSGTHRKLPSATRVNVKIKVEYHQRLDFCHRFWTSRRRSLPDPVRIVAKHLKRSNTRDLAPDLYRAFLDQDFNVFEGELDEVLDHLGAKHKLDAADVLTLVDFAVGLNLEEEFCRTLPARVAPAVHRPVLRTWHGLPVVFESTTDDCAPAAIAELYGIHIQDARAELWRAMDESGRAECLKANAASSHPGAFLVTLDSIRRVMDKRRGRMLNDPSRTGSGFLNGLALVVEGSHAFLVRSDERARKAFIIPETPWRLGWFAQDGSRLVGSTDFTEAIIRRAARKLATPTISSGSFVKRTFWESVVYVFMLVTVAPPINWDDWKREDTFADRIFEAGYEQAGYFGAFWYIAIAEFILMILAMLTAIPFVLAVQQHGQIGRMVFVCLGIGLAAYFSWNVPSPLAAFLEYYDVTGLHFWRALIPLVYAFVSGTKWFRRWYVIACWMVCSGAVGSILGDMWLIVHFGGSLAILEPALRNFGRHVNAVVPVWSATVWTTATSHVGYFTAFVWLFATYWAHGTLAPVFLGVCLIALGKSSGSWAPKYGGTTIVTALMVLTAYDVHVITQDFRRPGWLGADDVCARALRAKSPRAALVCHPDKGGPEDEFTGARLEMANRLRRQARGEPADHVADPVMEMLYEAERAAGERFEAVAQPVTRWVSETARSAAAVFNRLAGRQRAISPFSTTPVPVRRMKPMDDSERRLLDERVSALVRMLEERRFGLTHCIAHRDAGLPAARAERYTSYEELRLPEVTVWRAMLPVAFEAPSVCPAPTGLSPPRAVRVLGWEALQLPGITVVSQGPIDPQPHEAFAFHPGSDGLLVFARRGGRRFRIETHYVEVRLPAQTRMVPSLPYKPPGMSEARRFPKPAAIRYWTTATDRTPCFTMLTDELVTSRVVPPVTRLELVRPALSETGTVFSQDVFVAIGWPGFAYKGFDYGVYILANAWFYELLVMLIASIFNTLDRLEAAEAAGSGVDDDDGAGPEPPLGPVRLPRGRVLLEAYTPPSTDGDLDDIVAPSLGARIAVWLEDRRHRTYDELHMWALGWLLEHAGLRPDIDALVWEYEARMRVLNETHRPRPATPAIVLTPAEEERADHDVEVPRGCTLAPAHYNYDWLDNPGLVQRMRWASFPDMPVEQRLTELELAWYGVRTVAYVEPAYEDDDDLPDPLDFDAPMRPWDAESDAPTVMAREARSGPASTPTTPSFAGSVGFSSTGRPLRGGYYEPPEYDPDAEDDGPAPGGWLAALLSSEEEQQPNLDREAEHMDQEIRRLRGYVPEPPRTHERDELWQSGLPVVLAGEPGAFEGVDHFMAEGTRLLMAGRMRGARLVDLLDDIVTMRNTRFPNYEFAPGTGYFFGLAMVQFRSVWANIVEESAEGPILPSAERDDPDFRIIPAAPESPVPAAPAREVALADVALIPLPDDDEESGHPDIAGVLVIERDDDDGPFAR